MVKRKILLACVPVVLLGVVAAWVGDRTFDEAAPPSGSAISAEKIAYLAAKVESKKANPKRYDKPKQAWLFYAAQRAPVGSDQIPVEKYASARAQMDVMPRYSAGTSSLLPSVASVGTNEKALRNFQSWKQLGPGNVGGRTRALVIHPRQPRIMYIAGVAGGVWRTTNAGKTWVALDDLMANLAVTTLAMRPGNPRILYAGTGEGFFNIDAVRGNGIFRSANNGRSWKQLASTANNSNFAYVNKIVISSVNPRRIYAATRTGIWRSLNGGGSWRSVYAARETAGCLDLVIRTDTRMDHILAACGSLGQTTVYRSTNNGVSFKAVLSEVNMGKTSLAIAPSKQRIVYALTTSIDRSSNYYQGLHAVFRSGNGGKTWVKRVTNNSPIKLNTLLLTNPLVAVQVACGYFGPDLLFNQGWYDNVIAVDPKNPNVVWAGGIDLFRSDDGGKNWGLASYWLTDPGVPSYVHADQHAIVFHPKYNGKSNRVVYVTNDGGIFRTNNARAATAKGPFATCDPRSSKFVWRSLSNGYAVTLFYHGVPYPNGTQYVGGTQDNGTQRGGDATGPNRWVEIRGGDGGYVAVDRRNTNVVFVENTRLSIQKSVDGGINYTDATNGIFEPSGNFLFINPFLMDPNNPDRLWTGGGTAWRTDNQAGNWVQASPTLMSAPGRFSAWAVAKSNSNFVAGGNQVGSIFVTKQGTTANSLTNWTARKPTPGFVSSLAFNPKNSNILYATYSTFGVNHVWKSNDAGNSWKAIDRKGQARGIPDIPAHVVVVDPERTSRLFVGTDLGVFVSTNGGRTWAVENTGFANVAVEHLEILTSAGIRTLYAFTHGRGVWKTRLSP